MLYSLQQHSCDLLKPIASKSLFSLFLFQSFHKNLVALERYSTIPLNADELCFSFGKAKPTNVQSLT